MDVVFAEVDNVQHGCLRMIEDLLSRSRNECTIPHARSKFLE